MIRTVFCRSFYLKFRKFGDITTSEAFTTLINAPVSPPHGVCPGIADGSMPLWQIKICFRV